jgi:hypothetical protein
MSITLSPAKARYLEQVRDQLSDLPEEEREEIVQDLEAHLAELEDTGIEAELGDPEAFASEFRSSAGLDKPTRRPRWDAVPRAWNRVVVHAERLGQLVQWPAIRPVWIWTRGWLVICAWALINTGTPFLRFPIPLVGNSSLTGLILVALVTWFSLWLERRPLTRRRRVGSITFSFVAGWALLGTLLTPVGSYFEVVDDVPYPYYDRLTTAEGNPINNVYAYDLEGNPVEVLLFDSEGRPLLTLPPYVYEEADFNPGAPEIEYDGGAVRFERDSFGRLIPNLYPLQLSFYDDYGRLREMPPPSLGLPSVEAEEATPGTTIAGVE